MVPLISLVSVNHIFHVYCFLFSDMVTKQHAVCHSTCTHMLPGVAWVFFFLLVMDSLVCFSCFLFLTLCTSLSLLILGPHDTISLTSCDTWEADRPFHSQWSWCRRWRVPQRWPGQRIAAIHNHRWNLRPTSDPRKQVERSHFCWWSQTEKMSLGWTLTSVAVALPSDWELLKSLLLVWCRCVGLWAAVPTFGGKS